MLTRSPDQQAASRRLESSPHYPDQCSKDRSGDKGIQTVHHASVARNELARILGAKLSLQKRFEKISALRGRGQQHREAGDRP